MSVKDVVQADYLAPPDSYSRVNNTMNSLDGLCSSIRLGIEESIVVYDRFVRDGEGSTPQATQVLERATGEAETAVREFEGTDEQLYLLEDLLRLLERAGRFDHWTRRYLGAAYEHPTHRVVARLADQAVRISKQVGRQKQVLNALSYLATIPMEYDGREKIVETLSALPPCFAQVEVTTKSAACALPGDRDLVSYDPK